MRYYWHAFCKEFWTRLFWACAIGHIVLIFLYIVSPLTEL